MPDEPDLTPFRAAEIAYDRALASDRVASARSLESVLGGDGSYTADVAFEVWQTEMAALGFGQHATEGVPA